MKEVVAFQKVQPDIDELIELIAEWYFDEWAIPVETTHQRLANTPNNDVIFQLVLTKDREPAATAVLYNIVRLLNVYPEYKKSGPWVALLYTDKKKSKPGLWKQTPL